MFDDDILVKLTMPGRTPRRPIRQEPKIIAPIQQQPAQPQQEIQPIQQQLQATPEVKPIETQQHIPTPPQVQQPVQVEQQPMVQQPQEIRIPRIEYNQNPRPVEPEQRTEVYPNRLPTDQLQQVERLAKGIFTSDFSKKR